MSKKSLHYTAIEGHADVAKVIQNGADVNAVDAFDRIALTLQLNLGMALLKC